MGVDQIRLDFRDMQSIKFIDWIHPDYPNPEKKISKWYKRK